MTLQGITHFDNDGCGEPAHNKNMTTHIEHDNIEPMTTLRKNKCLRCGHVWVPRVEVCHVCPSCKKYTWKTPPKPKKS